MPKTLKWSWTSSTWCFNVQALSKLLFQLNSITSAVRGLSNFYIFYRSFQICWYQWDLSHSRRKDKTLVVYDISTSNVLTCLKTYNGAENQFRTLSWKYNSPDIELPETNKRLELVLRPFQGLNTSTQLFATTNGTDAQIFNLYPFAVQEIYYILSLAMLWYTLVWQSKFLKNWKITRNHQVCK